MATIKDSSSWASHQAYPSDKSMTYEQMELQARLRLAFQKGARWRKMRIMGDAVEGEICGRVYDHINVRFADGVCKYLEPKNISHIPADVSKYNIGDKVRIIVMKEEEQQ